MLKTFKIEINPTSDQKLKINQTIGVCRFIYNLYISKNKEIYESDKIFWSAFTFSKWLNNDFVPNNPSYNWIKDVSSKSVKKSIVNAETAFKKFFKRTSKYPRYKKRSSDVKMYLVKDNKTDCKIERHRVNIPTLKFVRVKEFGYVPLDAIVKSMTVSKEADRYFVSVLCEVEPEVYPSKPQTDGIGIDLGIKDLAIISNDKVFKNVNKTTKVKKLSKKLKREQRSLSRKSKKKGESNKNRVKSILKVQKLHRKLRNIRTEYVRFVVNSLVKSNPKFIAIEDLNVSGMMKNRHLSKAIQQQMFYYFRLFLIQQCKKHNIELRVIDRFYPSSKTCCCCGYIKKDLKLKDRTFICDECGLEIDRDLNASINIRDCEKFKLI